MLSPRQPARQRAAQPRRHRPPRRPALAARVPDVPRRRDREPARLHVGGRGAGAAPALRRRRRAGDDRARADHPHRARADDARRCCSTRRARTTPTSRSLRHVQYAASPISAELQRRVLERLPDCDVAQFYGMTEAAPTVTHLSGEDHRRGGRAARLGRHAGAGRRGRGAGPEANRASCGSAARTSCSATGTARTRPPRRSSTAGTAPATSSPPTRTATSTCVDRAKDMIITGGENVYSLEVEAALLRHPAVAEAAAFAVPDDRWGEAVHAVVVPARAGHRRRPPRPLPRPHRRLQAPARDRPPRRAAPQVRRRQDAQDRSSASRSGRAASAA